MQVEYKYIVCGICIADSNAVRTGEKWATSRPTNSKGFFFFGFFNETDITQKKGMGVRWISRDLYSYNEDSSWLLR